jgi:hypothetical protein
MTTWTRLIAVENFADIYSRKVVWASDMGAKWDSGTRPVSVNSIVREFWKILMLSSNKLSYSSAC